MHDFDSVRRHPVLWSVGIFATGFPVGFAITSADGASFYEATLLGSGTGLICTLICLTQMGIGGQRLARPPLRRLTVFDCFVGLAGLTALVAGGVTGNWSTALAGLPLVGFAAAMTLARHLVLRRQERRGS
jgi:hypothetical protein